eukprot:NODE_26864_length_534_cov_4.970516.p1 GENE.NODE_26864_length_534_cov_4.970516~~NODE_26864_length_534_cov_4.970516.p1  ORF type:complete len:66 (-),score=15.53 NODE_26864_length_534_cov_4.970516:233-430(-)
MPLFTLVIPVGVASGSKLTFEAPTGGVYKVEVPPGLFPGQTFQVEVPATVEKRTKSSRGKMAHCC